MKKKVKKEDFVPIPKYNGRRTKKKKRRRKPVKEGKGRPKKYPVGELSPGQSFFASYKGMTIKKQEYIRQAILRVIRDFKKLPGNDNKEFQVKVDHKDGGYRCWRTA